MVVLLLDLSVFLSTKEEVSSKSQKCFIPQNDLVNFKGLSWWQKWLSLRLRLRKAAYEKRRDSHESVTRFGNFVGNFWVFAGSEKFF
jgi:hypothetical protein